MPFLVFSKSTPRFSVWTIFFAVAFETGSDSQCLAINLSAVFIAIVNTLIHIRVALTRAPESSVDGTGVIMTTNVSLFGINHSAATWSAGDYRLDTVLGDTPMPVPRKEPAV